MLLAAGCAGRQSPAEMAAQCNALAADLAGAGLTGVPSQQQARDIAARLDTRVPQLRDPTLHDAAAQLHSHLHSVEAARRKGDTARAATAARGAREDITKVAKTCSMSEEQFLQPG